MFDRAVLMNLGIDLFKLPYQSYDMSKMKQIRLESSGSPAVPSSLIIVDR